MILAELVRFPGIDVAQYDGCACCTSKQVDLDFQDECGPLVRPLWICRDCADELRFERAHAGRCYNSQMVREWTEKSLT